MSNPEKIPDQDDMYRRIIPDFIKKDETLKSSTYCSDSVDWSKYTTPEESIQRNPPETICLAAFQAKIPRERACDVVHTPQSDNYSHSSLTGNLTQGARRHIAKNSKIILKRNSK